MKQHAGNDAALDEIIALAEKAARTIEQLRAENAALAGALRDCQAAVGAKSSEIEALNRRLGELEQASAGLRQDAQRYRWMRRKYVDSMFLHHIEQQYLNEHPHEKTATLVQRFSVRPAGNDTADEID